MTKTLVLRWLGPTFTKNGPENVQKMKNALFVLESKFFPYTFLLATPFRSEFQPPKAVLPIYKRRLPLQISTVLPAHPTTDYPLLFGVPSATYISVG